MNGGDTAPATMLVWCLLYLHNWDDDGKTYPEVHAVYSTWQEAENVRLRMSNPKLYWTRRANLVPAKV